MAIFFLGLNTGRMLNCGAGGSIGSGNAFSAAGWIWLADASANMTIVAKRSGFTVGTNEFSVGTQITTGKLQMTANASVTVTNTTIPQREWHHFVAVADGSSCIGYLDGVGSTPIGLLVSGTGASEQLCVGAIRGVGEPFRGYLAEIGVWNVKLTAAEAAQLARGVAPAFIRPASLKHYWPLYGGGSVEPNLADASSWGFAGDNLARTGATPLSTDAYVQNLPMLGFLPLSQKHYRFRTDADAADASPTWGAAEDSGAFDPGTSNFRLRFSIANTGSGSVSSQPFQIYLSKNSGAYAPITTTSTGGVKSADASSDPDNTVIKVPRLTPGA